MSKLANCCGNPVHLVEDMVKCWISFNASCCSNSNSTEVNLEPVRNMRDFDLAPTLSLHLAGTMCDESADAKRVSEFVLMVMVVDAQQYNNIGG